METGNQDMVSEKQLDLDSIQPIESSSVDLDKYDKKEIEIESAEVTQVKSQYSETGKQWVLKVQSAILETLETEAGNIDFRASELFNLIQDEAGKLKGYPVGEGSNLMKFLKDIGVKDADKLGSLKNVVDTIKGKKTLIKSYDKDHQGNKRTYLRFRY